MTTSIKNKRATKRSAEINQKAGLGKIVQTHTNCRRKLSKTLIGSFPIMMPFGMNLPQGNKKLLWLR
uniref:Uncharacterized protein n=1 Tax=Rhizophora mucronata TaxID=61149 RepID=A0A2P2JBT2_RHIMU